MHSHSPSATDTAIERPSARFQPSSAAPAAILTRRSAAATVLVLGLWWALVSAVAETVAVGCQLLCFGLSYLGSLQMHRYAIWAIGVSDILLLSAIALGLSALAFAVPRRKVVRVCCWLLASSAAMAFLHVFRSFSTLSSTTLGLGMGACFMRTVPFDSARFRRVVTWTFPLLVLFPISLYGWQTLSDARHEHLTVAALPAPPEDRPNILLVVLDTVPADALSCYGYLRPTTPNLDRLAARGARFLNARAAGTWTLPSHASLFTGRWPHELSARINQPLDETFPTLAETMRDRGYLTAGFVANAYFCNVWQGVARGFLHYADTPLHLQTVLRSSAIGRKVLKSLGLSSREVERPQAVFGRKNATTINREFLGWLDRQQTNRPFFVFLNYFDAHDPYLMDHEPEHPFGLRPSGPAERWLLRDWHLADMSKVTPHQVQLARDCYDDCLAELDRGIGKLIEGLTARGQAEKTWIVFTADHGEQFGEHNLYGHGNCMYRRVTHVPLLVIPPAGHTEPVSPTIEMPVSLCDVAPTVLDIARLTENSPFPGTSLQPLWNPAAQSGDARPHTAAISEIVDRDAGAPTSWMPGGSLTADGMTYIRAIDGVESLFDLAGDPEEATNLAGRPEQADRLARMRAQLDAVVPHTLSSHPAGRPEETH